MLLLRLKSGIQVTKVLEAMYLPMKTKRRFATLEQNDHFGSPLEQTGPEIAILLERDASTFHSGRFARGCPPIFPPYQRVWSEMVILVER